MRQQGAYFYEFFLHHKQLPKHKTAQSCTIIFILVKDVLQTMFNNSMSVYLTFGSKHVFVHLWKNSLWTWLHVYERGSPSSLLASNTVFLVYYPNAEYIFMSTIKAAHKQYILQVKEYNIDKHFSKFYLWL